MLDW